MFAHYITNKTASVFTLRDGIPNMSLDALKALEDADKAITGAITSRPGLDIVVTHSNHEDYFNLGGDLRQIADWIDADDEAELRNYAERISRIQARCMTGYDGRCITVALVDGTAVGGGWELALSHQIVVARKSARFAFPEARFGLYPGMGGAELVRRRSNNSAVAIEMLKGEFISGEKAKELGLVDVLVDDDWDTWDWYDWAILSANTQALKYAMMQTVHESSSELANNLIRHSHIWASYAMFASKRNTKFMRSIWNEQNRLYGGLSCD